MVFERKANNRQDTAILVSDIFFAPNVGPFEAVVEIGTADVFCGPLPGLFETVLLVSDGATVAKIWLFW